MKKKVLETSYDYKRLKSQYPDVETFFEVYYSGDYLNKGYSTYYDEKGNELETETYSYYG